MSQSACLLARSEPGTTGTSRYVAELKPRLAGLGWRTVPLSTVPGGGAARVLGAGRQLGFDLSAFLASYPIRVRWPSADVYHLTSQTYASVLLFNPPPRRVVVTAHDIIPYLVRHDARLNVYRHRVHRLFDWLAMRGLRRADAVIADSAWTRRTVADQLGIPDQRIGVAHLGVDTQIYRPQVVPESFRLRYDLPAGPIYVLYVGSEDPRKDLETLWRAFAALLPQFPTACLLKGGQGHHQVERRRLSQLSEQLGIAKNVHFLENVGEEDLPLLYNAASVYVQPSLYEGFGLPVLEALASGTPVICAQTSALTEVAGGAALMTPAGDGQAMANQMARVLGDTELREDVIERGRRVAQEFTWARCAQRTVERYALSG